MSRISAAPARTMFDVGASAGLDPAAMLAGLSFDARTLRRLRRVEWDDYCTLFERVEEGVGGAERFDALVEASYHAAVPPAMRTIARSLVSPAALCRFFLQVVDPMLFPNMDFVFQGHADGSMSFSGALHEGERPCLSFMRSSVAAIAGLPAHLGLPPARVEVEELTPLRLLVLVWPPPSETLLSRVPLPSVAALGDATLRLMSVFARDARDWSRGAGRNAPAGANGAPALDLTPRQADVLARVARGLSNKEIAAELACAENTVEFHVTQLLRKAGVQSRTQLLAKLAAERG
jgi:DNA-binding CsgD family transcriptional regulator